MNPVEVRLSARRKTKLQIVKSLIAGLSETDLQHLADELPDVIVDHVLTAADNGAACYAEFMVKGTLTANARPAAVQN